MDDSRLVNEAIQGLVDENKDVASARQLIDELKKELGNRGCRYLERQTRGQLDSLYEQYRVRRQKATANSPVDSHLDSEIASSSYDDPMEFGGGPPLVVTDRSQQRHASFNSQNQRPTFASGIFSIKIIPEHIPHPGREMIRSARRDPQSRQSLIDPRTAADFFGCTEADVRVGDEVLLRWCGYKDGSDTGQPRNTSCKIEYVQGANVVFERDLCEKGEGKNKRSSSGDEGDDQFLEILGQLNVVTARQIADRKRSTTNRDDSQRKRTKY